MSVSTVFKAIFGVVKHIIGISHVTEFIGKSPVGLKFVIGALGTRGIIAILIGLYLGSDDFRHGINQAIWAVIP